MAGRQDGRSLDEFVRLKFDPLLAVVKELTTKLRESEADRAVLERRVRRLEQQMDNWRAGTVIDVKIPEGDRLADVKPGSGVAPYSGLHEALDAIVANKDVQNPSGQYNMQAATAQNNPHGTPNPAKWLFSAPERTSPREIYETLDFGEYSYVELNVHEWQREEDLWLALLRGVAADAAVHEQHIREQRDGLERLRKLGADCLMEACKVEVCFTLRGVPGKDDAQSNPTGLRLVAVFVASVANAWKALEDRQPDQLGRIAAVLCGSKIGMNLRAGDKKFKIEPLA